MQLLFIEAKAQENRVRVGYRGKRELKHVSLRLDRAVVVFLGRIRVQHALVLERSADGRAIHGLTLVRKDPVRLGKRTAMRRRTGIGGMADIR